MSGKCFLVESKRTFFFFFKPLLVNIECFQGQNNFQQSVRKTLVVED